MTVLEKLEHLAADGVARAATREEHLRWVAVRSVVTELARETENDLHQHATVDDTDRVKA